MAITEMLLFNEPDPFVFIVKLAGLAVLAAMWLVGIATVLECVSLHRRITRRPQQETFLEWKASHGKS